jgi:hypothetical protein
MQGIKTPKDISLIVEVSASQAHTTWIQYFQGSGIDYRSGKDGIPMLFCPTGVMAPEAFPLLASGQLSGMLGGVKGAAEYETILFNEHKIAKGFGTQAMASQSLSHFLILTMVILGNVGMYLERKRRGGVQ